MKNLIRGCLVTALLFGTAAIADDAKPAPKKPAPAKKVAMVDINSATQKQLEAIPGIGKEHCHHIIYGRPYSKKEELVSKEVLPQEVYAKVEHLLIAKAPPAKKKTKR